MRYQERVTPVVGAVLWQRTLDGAPEGTPIMPDGCLDLLWDGNRLLVAGPDTATRWHRSPAGTSRPLAVLERFGHHRRPRTGKL